MSPDVAADVHSWAAQPNPEPMITRLTNEASTNLSRSPGGPGFRGRLQRPGTTAGFASTIRPAPYFASFLYPLALGDPFMSFADSVLSLTTVSPIFSLP